MPPTEMDKISREYLEKKASLSDKQRAEFENRIWQLAGQTSSRTTSHQEYYMKDRFGGTTDEYQARKHIFNAEWAWCLWDRIEKDMTSNTASNLVSRARNLSKIHNIVLEQALQAAIVEYDSKPSQRQTRDGKFYRTGKPKVSAESVITSNVMDSIPEEIPEKNFNLIVRIEKIIQKFTELQPNGINRVGRDQASEEFVDWIKEGYENYLRSLRKLRRDIKDDKVAEERKLVGRSNFNNACEVLGISGSFGEPVDLKRAKSRKWERASKLHPDKNKGNMTDAMLAEYQAVLESFKVLEAYAAKYGSVNSRVVNVK